MSMLFPLRKPSLSMAMLIVLGTSSLRAQALTTILFLSGPAAEESLRPLLDSLLRSTVRHDVLTLQACERAIEHVLRGKELANWELAMARDLTLKTYHQSDIASVRERSLDLIDRLLELEVDGLERALFEIETRR
jgi:hypothetical protein